MKHHRIPRLLAVICLSLLGITHADEPEQLKGVRFEFQAKLAEMMKPLREFDGKYAEHLGTQKLSYQNAGKLEAMLAVDEELKWLKDKPIEENPSQGQPLSSIPDLKRLQRVYREQWIVLETKYASPEKKLALIQIYRKKTGDLASGWTRSGMIDEAKLALAESKRFSAMEHDAQLAAKAGRTIASGPALINREDFAGKEAGEEMRNGNMMKLCWIPAGKFAMGTPESETQVELTRGFWMGKYEVTQEDYEKIAGSNPARFKEVGEDAAVEQVSWDDAVAFCAKLSELERERGALPEGWAYTLPTEAQWEYACRAGEKGPYSGGEIDDVGWYVGNSERKAHEVGKKKANAWGLHDVHGNVWEWCLDWYASKLSGGKDPTGPASGTARMHRGGGWRNTAEDCAASHRYRGDKPTIRYFNIGFRVILSQ